MKFSNLDSTKLDKLKKLKLPELLEEAKSDYKKILIKRLLLNREIKDIAHELNLYAEYEKYSACFQECVKLEEGNCSEFTTHFRNYLLLEILRPNRR